VLQRRGNHDTFDVIRVDVVRRPDLAERFRIAAVPTIVVIENNRVQGRLERPRGNTAIAEFLKPWLLPSQARG
jgi:thioredoxin-like negative regulator of GroEL